ncbi:MAG TPA: SBBP repeat-containing protein [Thermoanaerobaculia bacterium]|nr:SBBP repeat-containing protein [Thermoanaerobaculia bacterium]
MAALPRALGIGLMSLAACALQAEVLPFGQRPLAFEENRGQTDGRVKFLSRGSGYNLFLTATEAVLALRRGDSARTLRLRWAGADPASRITGELELPGRTNYLVGKRSAWRTGIASYGRVRYEGIYPGTALVFYGRQRQLEYDLVLAPGADPRDIRLVVEGADRVEIDPAGDLALHLEGAAVHLRKPVAYQEISGVRREIGSRYRLLPVEQGGAVGFEVAAYDPARTLVIDPVLAYSTFLGGGEREEGNDIAVDPAGNAYVTGWTFSPDFPLKDPLDDECELESLSCVDAFVAKLDPAGALVYSTFLGGSGDDRGNGIAADGEGNAYVVGQTSFAPDFPRVNPLPGPIAPRFEDAFAAKLDPTGSALVYSTTLGGAGSEVAEAVAVDAEGHALLAGSTTSTDFPTVGSLSPTLGGGLDGFVAKLSPSGSSLVYSTYLGGTGEERALGIATDAAGNAHVCGPTESDDFPLLAPVQPQRAGTWDAFVTKLSPSGGLLYSTYLGGSHDDAILCDLAADAAGSAYVFGLTSSPDFPLLDPLLTSGTSFLAKLGPAGGLAFSTLVGELFYSPTAIALDGGGNIHLAGFTDGGARVAKLAPEAAEILYSLVLGGTGFGLDPEGAWGIAADANGDAYVTGVTFSPDFPVVNAFQPIFGGGEKDVFISKITDDRPPDCSAASASPAVLWPPNGKLVPVAIGGVADPDGDPVAIVVTAIRQDEPLAKKGAADASGVGSATARLRAERAGGGDGRVYHVSFEAADPQGGTCRGTVTVCVPHDRRPAATCGDGGALFDSTGPGLRAVALHRGAPLAFEANRGQTAEPVRFVARGAGYELFLTPEEAVLALRGRTPGDASPGVVRLRWAGANPAAHVIGEAELPGRSHYLRGDDPARWRTGVPRFARVRYQELYPGIDLVFYGAGRQVEYDVVAAPGTDPRRVRLALAGAGGAAIDAAGDLVLRAGDDELRLRRPLAYQETRGEREEIGCRYRLSPDGREVGFELAAYDAARPLVIDPVLEWSTYLGGSDFDLGEGVALDAAGNVYLTGLAGSLDFPYGGPPPAIWDAYLIKLDPDGQLVFATYLGGSGEDDGRAVALDAAGSILLAGVTTSPDFPRVHPVQPPFTGEGRDAFVAKLAPDGSILYSTNLGGAQNDEAFSLAVDPAGNAYVTGFTLSADFPLLNPIPTPPPTLFFDQHAFVTKLAPGGALAYSTWLGGSRFEFAFGIAADAAGHAYVVGSTGSGDFPTLNPFQATRMGGFGDGFVSKLHPSGSSLVYSTYLGGDGYEQPMDVTLDAAGRAYLTGLTDSTNFPLVNPVQAARGGGDDLFVTAMTPAGSALAFSTYLGGRWGEFGNGIALDGAGRVWVTGHTESADFPLRDPLQTGCGPVLEPFHCVQDAIVAQLDPAAPALLFSTRLGGAEDPEFGGLAAYDTGQEVALDAQGNVYVTGYTQSSDFPVVDALQPLLGGYSDAFAFKLAAANRPPDCAAAAASPALLWPANGKLVPVAIRGVTDPDGDPVAIVVTAIRQDEPPAKKGSPDAAGVGTATPRLRAERLGSGDGRVYHVDFTARDGAGGECTGTVRVCVPHDQRPAATCKDGGPLYDSTAGRP